MQRDNPDVVSPTRGSKAHGERQVGQDAARDLIDRLFDVNDPPLLKKDLLDAICYDQGCHPETAQTYIDALCSKLHPDAPYFAHTVNRQAHVSPKVSTPRAEDTTTLLLAAQPPQTRRTRQRKGGGNA